MGTERRDAASGVRRHRATDRTTRVSPCDPRWSPSGTGRRIRALAVRFDVSPLGPAAGVLVLQKKIRVPIQAVAPEDRR